MGRKILAYIATTVLALAVLSLFGWSVKKELASKQKGLWHTIVTELVALPDLFSRAAEEVQRLPETFVKTSPNWQGINTLENDVYIVESFTNAANNRSVQIRNLKDDRVAHSWELGGYFAPHHRIFHPLVLADTSLIYAKNGDEGVRCVDAAGQELWHQKEVGMHHAMNLDHKGNIWVCGYDLSRYPRALNAVKYQLGDRKFVFTDNYVAQIHPETGDLLFKKSLADLIFENDLFYLFAKSAVTDDPIHLNDVQPVLTSGPFMDAGDLFLSFRTSSVIIQYRPMTDEIIRVIEGPFANQHDVDILNDSTIAIFNNNAPTRRWREDANRKSEDELRNFGTFSSHIVHYNLSAQTFTAPHKDTYAAKGIYTFTEGLFEYLDDGAVLIEEQNPSLLWIFQGDSVRYKGVLPSHHEGYHHLTNWSRPVRW